LPALFGGSAGLPGVVRREGRQQDLRSLPGDSGLSAREERTVVLHPDDVDRPLPSGPSRRLYGLSHGLCHGQQYVSSGRGVVIGSALVPTLIANAAFLPRHLLPRQTETERGADAEAVGVGREMEPQDCTRGRLICKFPLARALSPGLGRARTPTKARCAAAAVRRASPGRCRRRAGIFSGRRRILVRASMRGWRGGCTPTTRQAPRPKACAASSRFSIAAEQSCSR